MSTLRLATRRSPLALAQAHEMAARLQLLGVTTAIVELSTTGDDQHSAPLASIAGQGVFAREIQRAVLDGRADVAVHSAKDLPSVTPDGLVIGAVPKRADVADVLVGRSLAGLGPGATVATGSPRRRALLANRRPDLNFVELRGNMATRLDAVQRPDVDAVVAAAAALERLGWSDRVAERLDPHWCTPQVGQAALALEVRTDDVTTLSLVAQLHDDVTGRAVTAERAFLRELGAGCAVPAAAYATVEEHEIHLRAIMASPDGATVLRYEALDTDADRLGVAVARVLRDERGGGNLPSWR